MIASALLASLLAASGCAARQAAAPAIASAPSASEDAALAALIETLGQVPTAKRIPESGIAEIPPVLAAAGVQRFVFSGWPGAPLPVWYLRPASAGPDAPVVFVMHGVGRDADRYIAEWVSIAKANGLVLVVPEFPRGSFRGNLNYNFGAVFDESGALRPRELWSYSAIDSIFDAVVVRERLNAARYVLLGHSAGAQFVHRFVLLGAGRKMSQAIAANAGSYMLPSGPNAWPFGTNGLPQGVWQPAAGLGAPMLVLLGTADSNPKHPSLPSQPEAVAQGPHRLARGNTFYAAGREAAKEAGVRFGWSCALVPGVGHDNGGMAAYAVALLKAPTPLPAGKDCVALAKR